jgi:hypothetical protein
VSGFYRAIAILLVVQHSFWPNTMDKALTGRDVFAAGAVLLVLGEIAETREKLEKRKQ